jgi:hypothetical protein
MEKSLKEFQGEKSDSDSLLGIEFSEQCGFGHFGASVYTLLAPIDIHPGYWYMYCTQYATTRGTPWQA